MLIPTIPAIGFVTTVEQIDANNKHINPNTLASRSTSVARVVFDKKNCCNG